MKLTVYTISMLILLSCTEKENNTDKKSLEKRRELFGNGLNSIRYFGESRPKEEVIELGRMLFYDTRLSNDKTVSCSKCHLPQLSFSDALPKSIGAKYRLSHRNAQTLINTAAQISQHWNGNRNDVEEQAKKAFFFKGAYDLKDSSHLKKKLVENNYNEAFKKAFNTELITSNENDILELSAKSIGAFERTLVGPAIFDDYLEGKDDVLNLEQKSGLKKFTQYGCIGCHNGNLVGGGMYQKFGIVEDPYKYTKSKNRDLGRYTHTKNEDDKEYFKVPPLRNVTKTSPYFHDGSVASLDEAIDIMGRVQLGVEIPKEDRKLIIEFLKTLETKEEHLKELTRIPDLP
ncbi:cytochrome-c peroxidase [Halobacteriovorax sp.]|uniref:cytochrome-c peroxidase n=1 Tax=Halobacteriovorax sp. TaxID=2020862 RepID=UPI003AF1F6B1